MSKHRTPRSTIRLQLRPGLTAAQRAKGHQIIKPLTRGTLSQKQLLDHLVGSGGGINRAQAVAVLTAYHAALEQLLAMGHSLPLGDIGYLQLNAHGLYDIDNRPLPGKAPTFELTIRPKAAIRKLLKDIPYTIHHTQPRAPIPAHLHDLATDTYNTHITPGGTIRLICAYAAYDEDAEDEGIFFIPSVTPNAKGIRVPRPAQNTNTLQIFLAPATLTPGQTYLLQIRTRYPRYRKLSTGNLAHTLTATAPR